jgi:hypothetical protein
LRKSGNPTIINPINRYNAIIKERMRTQPIEPASQALKSALTALPKTIRTHHNLSKLTAASCAIHFFRYALVAGALRGYRHFLPNGYTYMGFSALIAAHALYTRTEGLIHTTTGVFAIDNAYATLKTKPHTEEKDTEPPPIDNDTKLIRAIGLSAHYILGEAILWVLPLTLSCITNNGALKKTGLLFITAGVMFWNGFQFFQYPLAHKNLSPQDQIYTLDNNKMRCFLLGATLWLMSNALDYAPLELGVFSTAIKGMMPLIGVALAHEIDITPRRRQLREHNDGNFNIIDEEKYALHNPINLLWGGTQQVLTHGQMIVARFGMRRPWLIDQALRLKKYLTQTTLFYSLKHLCIALFSVAFSILKLAKPLGIRFALSVLHTPAIKPLLIDFLKTGDKAIHIAHEHQENILRAQGVLREGITGLNIFIDVSKWTTGFATNKLKKILGLSDKLAALVVQCAIALDLNRIITTLSNIMDKAEAQQNARYFSPTRTAVHSTYFTRTGADSVADSPSTSDADPIRVVQTDPDGQQNPQGFSLNIIENHMSTRRLSPAAPAPAAEPAPRPAPRPPVHIETQQAPTTSPISWNHWGEMVLAFTGASPLLRLMLQCGHDPKKPIRATPGRTNPLPESRHAPCASDSSDVPTPATARAMPH